MCSSCAPVDRLIPTTDKVLITAPIAILFKILTFIEFLLALRHVNCSEVLQMSGKSRSSGLSQSEIAGNEKHYYDNTNDVENIVHVSFSFLCVIGLLTSVTFTRRKDGSRSFVVLRSDQARSGSSSGSGSGAQSSLAARGRS